MAIELPGNAGVQYIETPEPAQVVQAIEAAGGFAAAWPDGVYAATDEPLTIPIEGKVSRANGQGFDPGYYWIDVTSERYLDFVFDWIRAVGVQPVATEERSGRAWVLLHVPTASFIPDTLLRESKWSPAPNGAKTTLSDLLQSHHSKDLLWAVSDGVADAAAQAVGGFGSTFKIVGIAAALAGAWFVFGRKK